MWNKKTLILSGFEAQLGGKPTLYTNKFDIHAFFN